MNSTELIAALRHTAFIGDGALFPDYTDARLRIELTDALHTTFARAIVASRQGYWLRRDYYDHGPGIASLRIPPRALVVEQVAVAAASSAVTGQAAASTAGRYTKLEEVSETHAEAYELASGQVSDPHKYVIRADRIWLLPTPASTVSARVTYYQRPSALVEPQTAGLITAVDPILRTVTVDALPLDLLATVPAPVAVGSIVDIVHPDGWHDLAMWSRAVTAISAATPFDITLGGTDDMSDVRAGDYVRFAEQSEWPPLPNDFHRPLAETAAIKVMQQLNMLDKAVSQQQHTQGDISRFYDLIQPRVKAEARAAKAPSSVLQVGRARRGGWR